MKGIFPELYSKKDVDVNSFRSVYVSTYLDRDVSQIINLKDKYKFQNFMQVLASLTGEESVYDFFSKSGRRKG